MPATEESADSRLRQYLKINNQDLYDETQRLVQEAAPLLWRTLTTFPTGTSHTPEHTNTVELIAGLLVDDEMLAALSDDEIQLLILGCHYHDLGMAATETESATEDARNQARRDHAIRIGDQLRARWQEFGFRDEAQVKALAEVCRGHRPTRIDGIANWDDIHPTAILSPGRTARLRVVSALLYAADELHIGSDRASEKEENWFQLTNEESRRHWKRHQMIQGPAVVSGALKYIASPLTFASEADLREEVLSKAFAAVKSAAELLEQQSITGHLLPIDLAWNRDMLWSLEVVMRIADMQPRTIEEIVDTVLQAHDRATEDLVGLERLARIEPAQPVEVRSAIARVVGDLRVRNCLVEPEGEEAGRCVLNTDLKSATAFFNLARQADEIDVLFQGRHAAKYDFELQKSPYGIRHTQQCLEPVIRSSYGVVLPSDADEPLSILLRNSPTARRLAIEGRPAPSILSKPQALALAVLSGASLDLLREPELILEPRFRAAYKLLSKCVHAELPGFTRLIEELALVDGYTFEQLREALNPSPEAIAAYNSTVALDGSADDDGVQLTFSQQIPGNLRPIAVSLPHLQLAGQRARTKVVIVNTEDAPFSVKQNSDEVEETDLEISAMAISPGPGRMAPLFSQRAYFDFDSTTMTLTITVCDRTPVLNREAPLMVRLSTKQYFAATPAKTTFEFYWPALTAKHWQTFHEFHELDDTATVSARLISESGMLVPDHWTTRRVV